MQSLGASDEQIANYLGTMKPDDNFEVLEENWPIVKWFLETDDLYWFNGPICMGLNVQAVKDDADMAGRDYTPQQYKGLRLMGRVFSDEITQKLMKQNRD